MEFFNGLLVVAEILLAADQDDGEALAEVQHLGDPLCHKLAALRVAGRQCQIGLTIPSL